MKKIILTLSLIITVAAAIAFANEIDDNPPESYCRGMSVENVAIECTDEAGNPVLVDYFDDERTRIREDDFIQKRIIDMEMEGN